MTTALCAVLVLLLGGCGTERAGGGGDATPVALPWTTGQPSAVTGASLGDDGRALTVEVNVPSGPNPCVRDLKAVLTGPLEKSLARVQVTFSSPSGDLRSGCTEEKRATTRVELPEPLGHRDVVVDLDTVFTVDGADLPALRLCGELGCRPAPTGCTVASYEQALKAAGAPAHTMRDAEKCDGTWLVLDFSWPTGPACSGQRSPACSSRLGDRWFFKAEESGWVPIRSSANGGCADVRRAQPAFPAALCDGLAPLPPSLHPHYPPASATSAP